MLSGGKRDEKLILPVNDSVSGTLSTDQLCAKTTIAVDPSFTEDKMWLNGAEVNILENDRLTNCISYCMYIFMFLLDLNCKFSFLFFVVLKISVFFSHSKAHRSEKIHKQRDFELQTSHLF